MEGPRGNSQILKIHFLVAPIQVILLNHILPLRPWSEEETLYRVYARDAIKDIAYSLFNAPLTIVFKETSFRSGSILTAASQKPEC